MCILCLCLCLCSEHKHKTQLFSVSNCLIRLYNKSFSFFCDKLWYCTEWLYSKEKLALLSHFIYYLKVLLVLFRKYNSKGILDYINSFEIVKLLTYLKYLPINYIFGIACLTSFTRKKMRHKPPIRFVWYMVTMLVMFALVKIGLLA